MSAGNLSPANNKETSASYDKPTLLSRLNRFRLPTQNQTDRHYIAAKMLSWINRSRLPTQDETDRYYISATLLSWINRSRMSTGYLPSSDHKENSSSNHQSPNNHIQT